MSETSEGVDPGAVPSGTGCAECLATGGWWVHLRRCAKCGHIGCCDTSPSQHATAHFRETGHFIIASFEPGENWFWNYRTGKAVRGPKLAPPRWRPPEQPSPGPQGSVPADWEDHLNRE
jgi:ubiquitin-hydrolase Zn-finger-containing protein